MNSKPARLLKEARALLWPWCAVTSAGALDLFGFFSTAGVISHGVSLLGFWVGIPMLAALSLGNEFQHRTLPLLLSQPVSRKTIWSEKWIVLAAAVASATFVYWLAWRSMAEHDLTSRLVGVIALILLCSAVFWTLVGKSTIGGLILNTLQAVVIYYLVQAALWLLALRSAPVTGGMVFAGAFAGFVYACVMVWLGRRKWERFQTTGGIGGDDLLMANPRVLRAVFSRVLECRSTRPVLNLIRKEVRLLWPVWLLTVIVCLLLIGMAPFRLTTSENPAEMVASAMSTLALLLMVLLAGTLSMGEERNLGTLAWHMTMPVSVRTQWWIKIVVAQFTSVLSTAGVVLLGRLIFGSRFLEAALVPGILFAAFVATFGAFWCACAVKGTVRAAVFAFPATGIVFAAYALGGNFLVWLNQTWVLDSLISRMHPFPISSESARWLFIITLGELSGLWVVVPVLAAALLQSHRLFRAELADGVRPIIQRLLPLAIAAVLAGVVQHTPMVVVWRTSDQTWKVLKQVSNTVDNMKLDPAQPVTLSFEDLRKGAAQSDLARLWLKEATITVTPAAITQKRMVSGKWSTVTFSHYATIQLRHGWTCNVAGVEYGFGLVSCKSPAGTWGSPKFP
jgi:hypothetical protein